MNATEMNNNTKANSHQFKRGLISPLLTRLVLLVLVGGLMAGCPAPAASEPASEPTPAPAAAEVAPAQEEEPTPTPAAEPTATPAQEEEPTPAPVEEPTATPVEEEEPPADYIPGLVPPSLTWPQPGLCVPGAVEFRPVFDGNDEPQDFGEYYETRGEYENEFGQTFEILLRTGSGEAFAFYREGETQLLFCVEAAPVDDEAFQENAQAEIPYNSTSWTVDELRQFVAEQSGFELQEFLELLDNEPDLQKASPLSILVELFGIFSEDDAIAAAVDAIEEAGNNNPPNNPSPEFITRLYAGDIESFLLPFLKSEGLFARFPPPDFRSMVEILIDDPSAIFVEINPIDLGEIQMGEEPFVVFYAIDPLNSQEFGGSGSHYFTAQCAQSAYAQMYVKGIEAGGWMTLTFMAKGQGFYYYSSPGALQWSRYLSGSSGDYQTFDAQVYSTAKGSYDIYGGWYRGSGGACQ